ncbi:MAG: glycoside hydrolase family 3 protein, partial [Clostridia bacterium]|nr:glycoside hydrolase family 3 protein [Clostridia bacterium]
MRSNKVSINSILVLLLTLSLLFSLLASCRIDVGSPDESQKPVFTETPASENSDSPKASEESPPIYEKIYSSMSEDELQTEIASLLESMTIEDKIGQMIQGERGSVDVYGVKEYGLGSVLAGGGSITGKGTVEEWQKHIKALQTSIFRRDIDIPILYGVDAVHGHDHVKNPVIFPHNIGLGAANDEEAMYKYGEIVAYEMKATYMNWNFAPCVAVAMDPRWGRTYESFSSDVNLVTKLALPFMKALQDNGIVASAKHYIGDGGTLFGTGQGDYLIDRGDVIMSEAELRDAFLKPYTELIEAGVYTVMVSFSSFNGLKMHQNEYLINDVLKDELGFRGFVISDWEGHNEIDAEDKDEKIALAINSGIDMLMEPYDWVKAYFSILRNHENNEISTQRINDAVSRILWVKMKSGIFDNPYHEGEYEIGSDSNREIARELVEKSAVLLKNENDLLPLKAGTKVLVTGPAADNIGVQCGGWTIEWQGVMDKDGIEITEGTTLLEGLEVIAPEYGIEIITDINRIEEADAIILAIGEKPYTEGYGDSETLSIVNDHALDGNEQAIKLAKESGKPVVVIIYAGRNVMISQFIDDWDSVVMAYLPGTEGGGIAGLLTGKAGFR